MKLLIVESPTKAQTIKKFLGKEYEAISSYGHVRDLPKSKLGVDIEKNFEPQYVVPAKAKKHIAVIKKELSKADEAILATDEDREGEAIAWHLAEVLNLGNSKFEINPPGRFWQRNSKLFKRIVFHEITKNAIEEALKNPRDIDMNLVNAQQARRVLDRLVGYKLSPFLWKKVFRGLSAGRVQSVALRLVVDREKEIQDFKPQEYWSVEALLEKILNPKFEFRNKSKIRNSEQQKTWQFKAVLSKKDGKPIAKLGIKSKEQADEILKDLEGAEYLAAAVERKEVKKNPLPPFTTSTLQQTAWQKFKWPAKMTMRLAQTLYEKGFITYHRTDSLNISPLAVNASREYILEKLGQEYLPSQVRVYKTKSKSAQEAHEAIRPAYAEREPNALKIELQPRELKLYELIWRRFIACQMNSAIFDSTVAQINAKNYTFKATGQALKFDGFLKIYPIKYQEQNLPELQEGEQLDLIKLLPEQHFTQPPARYTEASLIKVLEKEGIGRPSTYAPILSTIQERNYVQKDEQKRFYPTEVGVIVNDLLVQHFPEIVDVKFTAKMEEELDEIAQGKLEWQKVMKEFYDPFSKNLEAKYSQVQKQGIVDGNTGKTCPECGAALVMRLGRFGRFYACSNFPKCTYTEPVEQRTGITCPKCQKGKIIPKRTKKGKTFYSCSNYPDCDFALWDKPTGATCLECGSLMVQKGKKIICSNKACLSRKKTK